MKNIIAVASGKGGVGKSSVALNLAVSLAKNTNKKIALIDCDFYGPSIPTLIGGGEISANKEGIIFPAQKYDIKYVSIAFFLPKEDAPVIWRGPMLSKAIHQLFNDISWGEIDICIVDMPPGTGDVQLSLSQQIGLSGAIMVSTPQEVSLSDVRRAINMFREVNVEIIGIIENMSGFTTKGGEYIEIFGKGGAKELSSSYGIPFLASLPFSLELRKSSDIGVPIVLKEEVSITNIFKDISLKIVENVEKNKKVKLNIVN